MVRVVVGYLQAATRCGYTAGARPGGSHGLTIACTGICPGGICPGGICPAGVWPAGIWPGGVWFGTRAGNCAGGIWVGGIWAGCVAPPAAQQPRSNSQTACRTDAGAVVKRGDAPDVLACHTATACVTLGHSLHYIRLQPLSHAVTASVEYGTTSWYMRLQPLSHAVTASSTYDRSL